MPTHVSPGPSSTTSVKSQMVSLYRKLGVSSLSEAVARIADLQLFA